MITGYTEGERVTADCDNEVMWHSRSRGDGGTADAALKQYTDAGFDAVHRSVDQFRGEFHANTAALHVEIDRRFREAKTEVETALAAQEKALLVKQIADETALDLARDIQAYKEEQHNGLLAQITAERSKYVTQDQHQALLDKLESLFKPLQEFMVSQIASGAGASRDADQELQRETRIRTLEGRVTADEGGDRAATRLRESRRSSLTLFAVVATALLFLVSVALSVVIATHGG